MLFRSEYSLQDDHLHQLAESAGRRAFEGGMRGLTIRTALGLNRALGRTGPLFPERYHAEVIDNPRQMRAAYAYVLNNPLRFVDPSGLFEWAESAGGDLTDEELFERGQDRELTKKERKKARRQYDFRQRFRAALERAKQAASSTRLSDEQRQQIRESADSYGDENDDNGVTVGIRGNPSGARGTTLLNQNDTVSVEFRFNLEGDQFATTVAHEGRHVADAMNWVYSGHTGGGSTDMNHHSRENRAWNVSSFMGQALNMGKVTAGSDNSGKSYKVWSRGWKASEIETKRANGIANIQNLMNLKPTDTDNYSREHPHRPPDH